MISRINSKQETIKQEKTGQKRKINMAILRIQKDLQQYQHRKLQYVKITFPDQNSIQNINITIFPQSQSSYYGTKVTFNLNFTNQYPMNPPKLICLNKIYHPNINLNGSVCLPLVRQDYNPTVNLQMIIYGLIFIMEYPDGQDALNPDIGDLLIKDKQLFVNTLSYTIRGRSYNNKQYDNIVADQKLIQPQFNQQP